MVAVYQQAATYHDAGQFRLQYRQDGKLVSDEVPFSVAFQRPNQLAMQAYQTSVKCDGQYLRAQVRDEQTNDLDGQILVVEAPASWDLDSLFQDPVLRDAVVQGLGRHPLPLELLLAEQPLEAIFREETSRQLLDPLDLEGSPCFRVEAETGEGRFVFWVDRETYHLRRLNYPAEIFVSQVPDPSVSEIQIVAEFDRAVVDGAIEPSRFELKTEMDTIAVSELRVPPRPLSSDLLARNPGAFSFVEPNGKRLAHSSLRGNVVTLLWFNDHPLGRNAVQQLDAVRAEEKENEQFRFLAICTEPSSRATEELAAKIEDWGVDITWVRDLEACGRDVFQIPWAPTLVVLDAAGDVQAFEVGFNPNLGTDLPKLLERLAAGDDVAAEIVAEYRNARSQYDDHLRTGSQL